MDAEQRRAAARARTQAKADEQRAAEKKSLAAHQAKLRKLTRALGQLPRSKA